jgi:hypothetical protein
MNRSLFRKKQRLSRTARAVRSGFPKARDDVKESMEQEIFEFMRELSELDEDLLTIRRHQRIVFGK